MNPLKEAWLIQGYDGLEAIFEMEVSIALSEREIRSLLQHLAARHLTPQEIVAASLRSRMNGYVSLLEVSRENRTRVILSCGQNPHYVASIHNEFELRQIRA